MIRRGLKLGYKILRALALTLVPPVVGIAAFYWTLYPYSFDELQYMIFRQLWYMNHYWIYIQFGINYYLLNRLNRKPKSSANIIILRGGE